MSITNTHNLFTNIQHQAAGFPPFSRGYTCIPVNTEVKIGKLESFNFEISGINQNSLNEISKQLSENDFISNDIVFNLSHLYKEEYLIITKTLRTLLSFILLQKGKEVTSHKCIFLTEELDSTKLLEKLPYINAAQINYLYSTQKGILLLNNTLKNFTPIDAFFYCEVVETTWKSLFINALEYIRKDL